MHDSKMTEEYELPKWANWLARDKDGTLRQLSSKLEAHSLEAINVLIEIMNDEDNYASTRVNAANKIIQLNIEVNQNENLLNRIEEIEKWIEN